MTQLKRLGVTVVFVAGVLAAPQSGLTHGDVTPQAMETKGLLPLGEEWLTENPYRGNPLAIQIGEHGYTQNCARCHGIDAISGGLSPDLRYSERGAEGDEIYIEKTRKGIVRNGAVYMPKFEGVLSQEAMWAIRSWLDTKSANAEETLMTAAAPGGSRRSDDLCCELRHVPPGPAAQARRQGRLGALDHARRRCPRRFRHQRQGIHAARAGKPALSDSDIKAAVEYMGAQPNSVGLPRVVLPSEWPEEPKPGAPRCHRGEGALNNPALIVGFVVPCESKIAALVLIQARSIWAPSAITITSLGLGDVGARAGRTGAGRGGDQRQHRHRTSRGSRQR